MLKNDDIKINGSLGKEANVLPTSATAAVVAAVAVAVTALATLEDSGVAAGPILNIQDMFEDPHYQARELFEEVSANGEPIKIPAIMPRLERTPGYTDAAGPTLGADTEQVLQEFLSMDEDLIEKLKKQEII